MNRSVSFAASDPRVQAAGDALVLDQDSALGVALAAYLWACATNPGVLLSPVSILLAGFGARRAFDGRVRQPGRGLSRPRGFREGEAVPDAARVAVAATLPAVFVAWGYDHGLARSATLLSAASAARHSGSPVRDELLRRAAASGGAAFVGSNVARELARVAGAAEGGLVTAEDFACVGDIDHAAGPSVGFPWSDPERAQPGGSDSEALVAIDRRGTAVLVRYDVAHQGLSLWGGELVCPLRATPVLRGVPRTKPGTPLFQRCAGHIELDQGGSRVVAASSGVLTVRAPS